MSAMKHDVPLLPSDAHTGGREDPGNGRHQQTARAGRRCSQVRLTTPIITSLECSTMQTSRTSIYLTLHVRRSPSF